MPAALLESLKQQQARICLRPAPAGAARLSDVDAGLPTNVLSHDDKLATLRCIIFNRHDWRECGISFTQGCGAFLRGASVRILNLADLVLNDTHAPTTGSSSDKLMLSIALRKATHREQTAHKDRHANTRVVGCLRHRNYIECPVGWLAFSFVTRFFTDVTSQILAGMLALVRLGMMVGAAAH